MILTIGERLTLLNLVPLKADFVTKKAIKKFESDIGFVDDEIKECNIRSEVIGDKTRVIWDKDIEKEIELGEIVTSIIERKLRELDKDGELGDEHLSLYEKFINTP